MVRVNIYTDNGTERVEKFYDITIAERYAMAVLGTETNNGTVTLVKVTDPMLGETTEFEY